MASSSKDEEISCVLCEEVFETKRELERHMRLKYNSYTDHGFAL
jgi:hypothetical protein